jgi:RimJ/RimL family protein N-acetyltransferase
MEIFNLTHEQTDWMLSYADENSFNAEQEADFLQTKTDSPDEIEILAEIDGRVIGTAGIGHLGTKDKVKHRAEFGISVDEDFWGLGIGRALTRACVECAKEAGYVQVELDVAAQNKRAIALYESEGFVEYGRNPKGFRSRFTGWQELVLMLLDLEQSIAIETERLILRPWEETDAESLYEYAKDPAVGPVAGWPVHTSIENSREIIRDVLSAPETYAVCLKEDNKAAGCVGLMIGDKSNIGLPDTEGEIGYWIGVPFWGQGLIPEAVNAIIRHAFADLKLEMLWCGYFEGNEKSKRVQEKCGFRYHHTNSDIYWERMGDIRTEHITRLTRDEWSRHDRKVSIMSSFELTCCL